MNQFAIQVKKIAQSLILAAFASLIVVTFFHQFVARISLGVTTVAVFLALSLVFWIALYLARSPSGDRVTKGTQLVDAATFDRKIDGDGLSIPCLHHGMTNPKILGFPPKRLDLRIRRSDENAHLMIVGDTGTGKSALQHTFLYDIAQRGTDRVIIYDPSLEFYERHKGSSRGDLLLHPLAPECPYWSISDEIRNALDAASLAESLIPDVVEGKDDFWKVAPRQVLRKMLLELKKKRQGVEHLMDWLADPELIFDLVEGTADQHFIDRNAHGQRAGVLASLGIIAQAIHLLPHDDGRIQKFTFTDWSANGTGWLFIGTKGVGERAALRPVISTWLDTAFARLMEHKDGTPTWVFIDELPSLQRLPSLKVALHEGRKYNLRFVIGFQGRSQLEQLYGREAEGLMSAPYTRIFLRTNEFAAADWAAKNIGMPERERDIESFTSPLALTAAGKDSVSLRTEKRTDYIVYPNEIQNLPKLTGYLRYDRFAVPIAFPYPTPSQPEQVSSGIRQLESFYTTANQLYVVLGTLSLGLIGYCYKSIFIDDANPHPLVKIGLLGCLFTALASALAESKKSKNAKQGADGEEDIFMLLRESLVGRGWNLQFNVMLADNWDVDVIAESPRRNTYIIDVKSHRGTKLVTNDRLTRRYGAKEYPFKKCFLTKAKSQAATVKERFKYPWVTPIVCFSDGQVEYLEERIDPQGVVVVSAGDLVKSLDILDNQ